MRNDRNIAALEQQVCVVCGHTYDTGNLLLDRKLNRGFKDMYVVSGFGLCPEDKQRNDDGYIALVGVDEEKSTFGKDHMLKPKDAYRTGKMIHLKRDVARKIFDAPVPDDLPMFFVQDEVIDKIMGMVQDEEEGA